MVSRITPAKSDLAIGERDQAMVGDGHTMSVSAKISKNLFRTAKGRLRIDDPLLPVQLANKLGKRLRFGQMLEETEEV